MKIFEYIPSVHKKFGTLTVNIPGKQPIRFYTTNHIEVEKHMLEILCYYKDLVHDIEKSMSEIKDLI